MKSVQFAAVATVGLAALAAAQSVEKKSADAPAAAAAGTAPKATASNGAAAHKDDKVAPKTSTGAHSPATATGSPAKKLAVPKDLAKDKKGTKESSMIAPDANDASRPLGALAAILGAAVIAGAYI
ncbi:hypothetical protein H4R19_004560 [Coemansia spiralis]|nr:hypothetical protein H4R19_004560 [Coemansia spiralis]